MKRSVGAKLFAAFACMLIVMAALGWMGWRTEEQINGKAEEINGSWLPKTSAILNVKYETEHFFALQLQYAMTDDLSKKNIVKGEADQTLERIQQQFDAYGSYPQSEEEKKYFQSLKASWSNYLASYQTLVEQSGEVKTADLLREADTMFQVTEGYLDNLVRLSEEGAAKATAQATLLHETGRRDTVISLAAALGISLVLSVVLTRHIRRPLLAVVDTVKLISAGRLGEGELIVKNRDEIGELAGHVHEMRGKLREFAVQVNETARHVTHSSEQVSGHAQETLSASNQIAIAMEQISAGSQVTVAGAEESAKAMEEMAVGIQRVAESTASLAERSVQAEQDASGGLSALGKATEQMNAITAAADESVTAIRQLGESSQSIQQIVEMITQIASQTNLLALNAAIEAARAGEQGRGFAVVAEEVRGLAERSDHFAKQIADLIRRVQDEAEEAAATMQSMSGDIHRGAAVVKEAETAFKQIVHGMSLIASEVQEVSAVAEEMSASVEELTATFAQTAHVVKGGAEQTHRIAEATQIQVQSCEEVTTSTRSLEKQAEKLKRVVGWFQLEPGKME